jgi:hypothetical protein
MAKHITALQVVAEFDSVMTELDFEICHASELCLNDADDESDACFESPCINKAK